MGKREATGDSRRAKKHKRHHKKHKNVASASATTPSIDEEDVDVEEQEQEQLEESQEVPAMEHEEEIVCDGEVELPHTVDDGNDEAECSVDVEAAEEEDDAIETLAISVPVTPTPTPPKPSKTSGSAMSKKSNSSKLTATPTTALTSPKPSTSAAATAAMAATTTASANAKKSKKRRDSGTSSDEERWLTAIESGKLEDVDDELKKIKDPKLMTARQRAMYDRNAQYSEPNAAGSDLLMSLPTGYREKEKPITAEEIQKAALKSQKRKQLADAKREKDKRRTMERLLKKQDSKQRSGGRGKAKATQPMISYRNSSEAGICIQMPPGVEFPLRAQVARSPPKAQLCGIAGCGQPKVYNCSKTNLPLCSFACYRKNVQAVRQIMC